MTPRTIVYQAPLSVGFSRQENWNGLPCSPSGDLPDPGIEPASPVLQADSLRLSSHQEALRELMTSLAKCPPAMWDLGLIPGLEISPGRERLPTPVFWPGDFHGIYSPWGRKESDMTERL